MKNKTPLLITVFLTAVIVLCQFKNLNAQLANNYPHDTLLHTDPDVLFVELFEESSVSNLLSGYSNITNSANISFDPSVPPGSTGHQSCKLTSYHTPSNLNATEMRKRFPVGVSDSVFVRFYVKYNNDHTHHHSGIWLHGSNPAKPCFPCIYPGRVGVPPGGDSAFSLGAELRGSVMTAQTNSRFGMYNYWTTMHPNNANQYYGDEFINGNMNAVINTTQWNCIEIMLKLNNPVTDSSGEAKLWINGQLVEHYGKDFPAGTWNQLTFTQGPGLPFEGFKWRSDPLVLFNSIWIKNYAASGSNAAANNILYDHIVVAKKYIGPIYVPVLLPVEVLSFTGSNQNRINILSWTAAAETNTSRFNIERSTSGTNFIKIGQVNGSGDTNSAASYSYTDSDIPTGILYYRLGLVDINGLTRYSKTITVKNSSAGMALEVFPNPANEQIHFSAQVQRLIVFNSVGQIILTKTNARSVSTAGLPNGTYLFNADNSFHKIIVRH